ncbi:MAG: hypothetical protein M3Q47_17525 [Actinomycetota bacterium]|nr:hypothetical protein [Actinomycetota bacterium]
MTAVIVTVDDAHLARVGAVAETLRERGLQVEQVLDEVGVISGHLPAGRPLTALRVDGVAAVEEAGRVRLAPPDAPVQ